MFQIYLPKSGKMSFFIKFVRLAKVKTFGERQRKSLMAEAFGRMVDLLNDGYALLTNR